MPDFSNRSYKAELLDADFIPKNDLIQNLKELNFINTYLGGHECVIKSFEKFIKIINTDNSKNIINTDKNINSKNIEINKNTINIINIENINNNENIVFSKIIEICEIGSGGGDNLFALSKYLSKKRYKYTLTGVDMKADCINYAQNTYPDIEFIESDFRKVNLKTKPDVFFNSLFCHHFTDESLVEMFRWMYSNSNHGFIVCDLHRHPLAYYSIKFLTMLFSKSYLVKNDAPLSVLRGFTKAEIKDLIHKAGITQYSLKWQWAFRWSLIVYK